MKISKLLVILFFLGLAGIFISSCTGSGESGNSTSTIGLSALIIPEKVSVVDPQSSGSGKPALGQKSLLFGIASGTLPATSDYATDRVSVYVNERSLESFRTVNEILCMVRQSRYDAMINTGPYRAQIDKNLCSSERDNAGSAGQQSTNQSSGSTMPEYETWTVNSYRTTSTSPHIVDVWVHSEQRNNDPAQVIYARVTITEGADTAPPYGIFKINFKALDPNNLSKVMMKAFLNAERDPGTGRVLLKFSAEDSNSYYIQKATLDKNADNTGGGSVLTAMTYTWMAPSIMRYNLAYDNNYFRRDDTSGSVCLDRVRYDVSAWRYGLYTQAGARVNVNSGFPIKKGTSYGWIGYWGSWLPAGMTLVDGETVMKHDYSTNSDTPYTVIRADGKLKKHTKNQVTLRDIKNIPLTWWDGSGNTFLVAWTETGMKTIAQLISNQTWSNFNPPQPFILSALPWYELGFWSPSLSGQVIIKFAPPPTGTIISAPTSTHCGYGTVLNKYDCSSPDDTVVPVVYYSENIVYPGDSIPAALACFDNCPNAATLATSSPYKPNISSYQSGTAPDQAAHATYSFNTSMMLLYDMATAVTLTTQNPNYSWGLNSGPLFDPAILSQATGTSLLACDWDANSTCAGKAWSALPVFYTWETGPNEWNKFTAVKDVNGVVRFDPPLQVEYTHKPDALAPNYKYDNTKFYLQYTGFGDLQGIPGQCVDIDSGATADCSKGGNSIRWVPEFTIPDIEPGTSNLTEVTNAANTSLKYIVKALEKEERMKTAPAGSCDSPSLQTRDYVLPSMSSYIDPALGAEPTITGAPAVIGGVVQ